MLIFASDTSLESASCALIKNNQVIKEVAINNNKRHAINFMPMVKKFFDNSEYSLRDVDLFAISSGPGSFTGLRIGITSIKSMAYALNKKIVMVPTLDILAFQSYEKDKIMCPLINARNNQVYTAIYSEKRETEYMGIHIDKLVNLLQKYDKDIVLSGDGVLLHMEYLKIKIKNKISFDDSHTYPKSSACGLMALNYDKIEAKDAVPFYLRQSQAERLFNK